MIHHSLKIYRYHPIPHPFNSPQCFRKGRDRVFVCEFSLAGPNLNLPETREFAEWLVPGKLFQIVRFSFFVSILLRWTQRVTECLVGLTKLILPCTVSVLIGPKMYLSKWHLGDLLGSPNSAAILPMSPEFEYGLHNESRLAQITI